MQGELRSAISAISASGLKKKSVSLTVVREKGDKNYESKIFHIPPIAALQNRICKKRGGDGSCIDIIPNHRPL
jgi:hypothetical protein